MVTTVFPAPFALLDACHSPMETWSLPPRLWTWISPYDRFNKQNVAEVMLSAGEARQRSGLQPPPEACSLSHPLSLSVFWKQVPGSPRRWARWAATRKSSCQKTVNTHIYMEFRKTVTTTPCIRQQKRHRCKEQTFGLYGRRRGWDDLRV